MEVISVYNGTILKDDEVINICNKEICDVFSQIANRLNKEFSPIPKITDENS